MPATLLLVLAVLASGQSGAPASSCADCPVYSDSMTPVSAEGFRFSDSREYPTAVKDFEKSFAFLRSTPCDILLTSHPNACWELAERAEGQLRRRLESEKGR